MRLLTTRGEASVIPFAALTGYEVAEIGARGIKRGKTSSAAPQPEFAGVVMLLHRAST